jgi:membrane-bound ClpP family serine protease
MDVKKKKTPAAPAAATKAKGTVLEKKVDFALGKENFIMVLIGIALILIGFLLMIGGDSKDPNVFSEDIFSFRRLTLAPILIVAGYIVEIFAIMKKPKPVTEE